MQSGSVLLSEQQQWKNENKRQLSSWFRWRKSDFLFLGAKVATLEDGLPRYKMENN